MEENALKKGAALIAKDFKGYIFNNFMVDVFQRKYLDSLPTSAYEKMGANLFDAFLNRYVVNVDPSDIVKCPKITIIICLLCAMPLGD
ncbi:MAG: hypothetical protein JST67_05320 [Bacteroidetes bacterium]|nr:hypothetical protein [Bacteroidota bacterium]